MKRRHKIALVLCNLSTVHRMLVISAVVVQAERFLQNIWTVLHRHASSTDTVDQEVMDDLWGPVLACSPFQHHGRRGWRQKRSRYL